MDRHKNEIEVVSSNISTIRYEDKTSTLFIRFYDESLYAYRPVSKDAYLELSEAESIGSYFNKEIKRNPDISWEKVS